MPRPKITCRSDAAAPVAKALRDFGYPDATTSMVKEVLDAFIEGKRDHDLPHGIVGMMAGRQFEEVDEARPGVLAQLENG